MYIFCNNYSEKLSEFHIHDDCILIGPTTGTSRRPVNRTSVFFRNHKLVPPKKIIKLNVYLMLRPNNYCVAVLPIK